MNELRLVKDSSDGTPQFFVEFLSDKGRKVLVEPTDEATATAEFQRILAKKRDDQASRSLTDKQEIVTNETWED